MIKPNKIPSSFITIMDDVFYDHGNKRIVERKRPTSLHSLKTVTEPRFSLRLQVMLFIIFACAVYGIYMSFIWKFM